MFTEVLKRGLNKNTKLLFCVMLLSLFFIPVIQAEEIFDEWILAGGNVTVDNQTIVLNYAFSTGNIMTSFGGEIFILTARKG